MTENNTNDINNKAVKPIQNGNGKVPEDSKDGIATTTVVVPPDGGWGWVVMFASFLCNVIVDGVVFTSGLFLKDIRQDFGAGEAEVIFLYDIFK